MKKSRLKRTLSSIKLYILLIIVFFISLSFFYSYYYKTPMYKSTAKLGFEMKSNAIMYIYAKQITKEETLEKIINNYNLEVTAKELSKLISVDVDVNFRTMEITVEDENNTRATLIATELINKLKEQYKEHFESNVKVLKKAEVQAEPYNINRKKEIGYPAALAVCLCIILTIITYIKNLFYDIYLYFKNRKTRNKEEKDNSLNEVYDNLQRMRNIYDNSKDEEDDDDDDDDDRGSNNKNNNLNNNKNNNLNNNKQNNNTNTNINNKNYYKKYETRHNLTKQISTAQKSISKLTYNNFNSLSKLDENICATKSQIILKK